MRIALCTDTNAGISLEQSKSLGIYLIHIPIIIDNEIFYEEKNISQKDIFDAVNSGKKVTTSQPSAGDLMDLWDKIFNDGFDQIIYIPMSSGLSHSYETARMLSFNYNGKILVVDNHRISVTLKNSVLYAKKMIDQNFNAQEIKDYLENDSFNSKIYLAVSDLNYLRNGGRIGFTTAFLGNFLSIRPILTIKGFKVDLFSKIRGNIDKCESKIVEIVKNDLKFNNSHVSIGLAGSGIDGAAKNKWINLVKNNFPYANIYYDSLPANISVHTGPESIGIGFSFEDI